jgi:hypothetical protein
MINFLLKFIIYNMLHHTAQNVWTFLRMHLSEVRALNLQRCSLKCGSKKHSVHIMTVCGQTQGNCEYENSSSLSTKNTLNVTSAP